MPGIGGMCVPDIRDVVWDYRLRGNDKSIDAE